MSVVFVKVKDKKHAEKVIKRLDRIGYKEWTGLGTTPLCDTRVIGVFSDGDYQLLGSNIHDYYLIKPKDVMNSEPVEYFLEHNHV